MLEAFKAFHEAVASHSCVFIIPAACFRFPSRSSQMITDSASRSFSALFLKILESRVPLGSAMSQMFTRWIFP